MIACFICGKFVESGRDWRERLQRHYGRRHAGHPSLNPVAPRRGAGKAREEEGGEIKAKEVPAAVWKQPQERLALRRTEFKADAVDRRKSLYYEQ